MICLLLSLRVWKLWFSDNVTFCHSSASYPAIICASMEFVFQIRLRLNWVGTLSALFVPRDLREESFGNVWGHIRCPWGTVGRFTRCSAGNYRREAWVTRLVLGGTACSFFDHAGERTVNRTAPPAKPRFGQCHCGSFAWSRLCDQGQQARVWTPEIPRACLICFRWHRHSISNERPHQVLRRGLSSSILPIPPSR